MGKLILGKQIFGMAHLGAQTGAGGGQASQTGAGGQTGAGAQTTGLQCSFGKEIFGKEGFQQPPPQVLQALATPPVTAKIAKAKPKDKARVRSIVMDRLLF